MAGNRGGLHGWSETDRWNNANRTFFRAGGDWIEFREWGPGARGCNAELIACVRNTQVKVTVVATRPNERLPTLAAALAAAQALVEEAMQTPRDEPAPTPEIPILVVEDLPPDRVALVDLEKGTGGVVAVGGESVDE